MERRGHDRDRDRESPVKLPLAPIISTRADRRASNVSSRRGSAIFSPTQTLDHHHLRTPPPPHVFPDPDPSTPAAADGGPSNSNSTTTASQPQAPPPPPPAANSSSVRYKECLKNHAASMGGHVVDGCGEFMPNGEEGSAEALRCAACDCHRNFHRKEVDGGDQAPKHPQGQGFLSFGGGGGDESSSDDLKHAEMMMQQQQSRKRFRTKFTQQQKDGMQELAEKLGWRIQKQDEQQVQRFCNETGVKRQVFKVWMHNNKNKIRQIIN